MNNTSQYISIVIKLQHNNFECIDKSVVAPLKSCSVVAAMEAAFLESEEYKQHMSVQIQNHIIREEYVRNHTNYCI